MKQYKIMFDTDEGVITYNNPRLAEAVADQLGGLVFESGDNRQDQCYLRSLEQITPLNVGLTEPMIARRAFVRQAGVK